MSDVPELQRLTTSYSTTQDRIRLAGEVGHQQRMILWLTQRLLNRLIAHLSQWLLQHTGTEHGHTPLVQAFEQQVAAASLAPQAPVLPAQDTPEYLVESIDIGTNSAVLTLLLKNAGNQPLARLKLTPLALRQWLDIVHAGYVQADWPMDVWPEWIHAAHPPATAAHSGVLH